MSMHAMLSGIYFSSRCISGMQHGGSVINMAAMLSRSAVFFPCSLTRSLPKAPWIRSLSSNSSENGNRPKPQVSSLLKKLKSSSPEPDLSTLSKFIKRGEKRPRQVEEAVYDQNTSTDAKPSELPTKDLIEETKGWKYNKVLREMRTEASRVEPSSQDIKSENLLGFLKKAEEDSTQDDGKSMLEKSMEETRRQKKKIFESNKKMMLHRLKDSRQARPKWVEKTLEDLEKKRVEKVGQSPKEVDPKLNQRIKDLLSDVEIAPKQLGTSRTIVAAVENWGKAASYQRKAIKDEYEYQTGEMSKFQSPSGLLLHKGERTGLFNDIVSKAKTAQINTATHSNFLYHLYEMNKTERIGHIGVRRNAFANEISLSNRLWKYPIDNEVCKVEEENTGFEEHVFLEYLLDDFPSKGPVRWFMELVINGLQKNPYLTVAQKKERVHWFHEYFSNFSEEELNF